MPADGDESADPDDYDALADAEVAVWTDENGLYIAEDEETGVSSQGPTEAAAVSHLAAAVDSYRDGQSGGAGDDWL